VDEFHDEINANIKLYWVPRVFQKHPDLFACWCTVDALGHPWALGLFDEDWSRSVSLFGRHSALITSPVVTLKDLPVCRTDFRETPWPKGEGLCLTVEHYTGMDLTFHYYPDGSGGVSLSVRDGCGGGEPCHLTLPYAAIREYIECTTIDPTRWHERPAWIRSPRPYNIRHNMMLDLELQAAAENHWFMTHQEELLRRVAATL
jgi:hypothetical protein